MTDPQNLSQQPLVYYEDGDPAAVLGLSMTFYFGSPGKRERRIALIQAIRHYCQQAKEARIQFAQYKITNDKKSRNLKPGEEPNLNLLHPMIDDVPSLLFELGGAPGGIAAPWSSVALAEKAMRENYLGYLLLTFPLNAINQTGRQGFVRQFSELCNSLEVEHAYAGLSTIFPYGVGNMRASREIIGNVLLTYPGMDAYNLNTTALGFENGIKSINFLTAVSHRILKKAGGAQEVIGNIDTQKIWSCEYSNGIIFQAGQQPELGSLNQPPPAYVALAKALKPARADFDKTLFYDPNGGDNKAFTQRWLNRFDV